MFTARNEVKVLIELSPFYRSWVFLLALVLSTPSFGLILNFPYARIGRDTLAFRLLIFVSFNIEFLLRFRLVVRYGCPFAFLNIPGSSSIDGDPVASKVLGRVS